MAPQHGGRQAQYHLNLIDSLLRNEPSSLDRGEAPRMTSQIPKVSAHHSYILLLPGSLQYLCSSCFFFYSFPHYHRFSIKLLLLVD